MSKKFRYCRSLSLVLFIFFIVLNSRVFAENKEIPPIDPFTKEDRVLILAPHPDDEDIGCGGVIQRALSSGAQVKVTYLTCGDNNIFSIVFYNKFLFPLRLLFLRNKDFVSLGRQRVLEAKAAMKILGMKESDLIFLGYPDHGTDMMFIANWNHEKPYKSSFSGRSNVPYEEIPGYNKGFTADNVIEDVKSVILSYKPTKIFVSSSSDVNGDHWAYYLYMMVSLIDLEKKIPTPKIYPYLVHAYGWPRPSNYHPSLVLEPPEKFFGDSLSLVGWRQLKLTEEEIDKKHKAMLAYDTQVRISGSYLMSFVRQNELFGDFPYMTLKKQHSSELAGKPAGQIFTSDMQWIGYAVVDDSLWIKVKKPKELKNRLFLWFGIFGYRKDTPFAKMPNVIVETKYNHFKIYDSIPENYIDPKGTSLDFYPEWVIFKIPLSVLGNPEGLLLAFETPSKYLPVGCTAFRVITIE